jgi:hypothetical protein
MHCITVQNGTQWNIDGEELREKQLPNLALDTLDEVIEKVCDGLKQLESDLEQLCSMTSSPHFRLADWNASWYKELNAHIRPFSG